MSEEKLIRCSWCVKDNEYMRYHDEEWGVPLRDGKKLFEFLLLDGAQAGLSWLTILKRREAYRAAFDGFDVGKIARYGEADINRLLNDKSIIRNKLKIESAIQNARGYLNFERNSVQFSDWLWDFVDGTPVINHFKTLKEVPSETPLSMKISKELKRRGFNFVGPTIIYSFMQAAGMVNDHLVDCFRWKELNGS
ncbi:MAG: DNA-3-methyladenine glycosylase I [Spirochaetaceae bacterium]|jgi:DNA-3-methyladenine glycosylase I|nr:DNA-3-methyladenine glycosylase I [Spirochaetaceae bacterium]GMO21882.1 MAG: DNA-3-methyladenine glycosylase I [Termitinemataceae bacterium]